MINLMIVRRGGKYVVVSEKTGRSFGSYKTKAEAAHRLKQVEFSKHLKHGKIPRAKIRKAAVARKKG